MPANVVLHVGYPKTASTYLQEEIFPQLPLNFVHLDRSQLGYILYEKNYQVSLFQELMAESQIKNDLPLLISNEGLCWLSLANSMDDIKRTGYRLVSTYPQAKILIIIREQFSFLRSLYAFRVCVKGLETRSFSEFLYTNKQGDLIGKLCFDQLVSFYIDLVGRDRVLVIPMESLKRTKQQFIRQICEFIEIDNPAFFYQRDKVRNSSTRLQSVILMNRLLNYPLHMLQKVLIKMKLMMLEDIYRRGYYAFRRQILLPVLNKVLQTQSTFEIPLDIYTSLQPIFAKSNAQLGQQMQIDLKQFGYPLSKKNYDSLLR